LKKNETIKARSKNAGKGTTTTTTITKKRKLTAQDLKISIVNDTTNKPSLSKIEKQHKTTHTKKKASVRKDNGTSSSPSPQQFIVTAPVNPKAQYFSPTASVPAPVATSYVYGEPFPAMQTSSHRYIAAPAPQYVQQPVYVQQTPAAPTAASSSKQQHRPQQQKRKSSKPISDRGLVIPGVTNKRR
jgi:mannitol-specific phosphotransferase system IIBC component